MRLSSWSLALSLLNLAGTGVHAYVTVYGQTPLGKTWSATGAGPTPTTFAAYNDTELIPPPLPTNVVREFKVELQRDAMSVPNLSIQHKIASFFGFSIEMSVINQVREYYIDSVQRIFFSYSTEFFSGNCSWEEFVSPFQQVAYSCNGITMINRSQIQVPFLNLIANLQERAGHVLIRLGGNTQEYAVMVDQLDGGRAITKEKAGHTQTARDTLLSFFLSVFVPAYTRLCFPGWLMVLCL
jgi:hypothetical protein